MNGVTGNLLRRALLGLWLALSLPAAAQSEPADDAVPAVEPRPAEIAGLAARSLLLDIARIGDGLVAVGDRGSILLSADGAAWQQVGSPVNSTLTALSFADARTGWVVGHDATVLKTLDGGKTWTLQHFAPQLNQALLNVIALDAQRVLALGAYGLFLGTSDGGATWSGIDAPAVLDGGPHLNEVIRLGNGELFMVGEIGLIGVSPDGIAWERLTLPYEGSLFGALPRGQAGAMVFGLRGNVLVSDDVRGGQWTEVDIGSVQSMFAGTALADGRAVLVGADGEIVFIGVDGRVSRAAVARGTAALGGGSLSGVAAWNGSLRVVGEAGVQAAPVAPVAR